ncbi:MAG TPA: DUF929 family protein [Ktedonobacteraceae bacterium]|nr:DUF929 family protein [Ktedonobacteraceae bacterium]
MSKSSQRSTSAAQRREQVRHQRQQRLRNDQHTQSSNQRRSKQRRSNNNPWLLVGIVVVLAAAVIGFFFFISNQSKSTAGADQTLKTLTSVDPKLLATVGAGNAENAMSALKGQPVLKGADGKPVVLYVGGEFCPFCAAQRWGMIVALSRFGTFGPLDPLIASEGSVPTYSFHNMTYQSQYIDFIARETSDNHNQPLDKLTPEQEQLVQKFDAPPYIQGNAGAIPFISIANQQVSAGSYYLPDTLVGLSYPDIATRLKDPTTDVSKGILGTANFLTAAICSVTQNQPANVCTADPIPQIQSTLPKASVGPTTLPEGITGGSYAMITRRPD